MTHLTSYSLVRRRRLSAHAHAGCLGTYVHVGRIAQCVFEGSTHTHAFKGPTHLHAFVGSTHTCVRGFNPRTCSRVQPMHVFEGSTHARVQGFNAPVGLLPFKLSSLPIRYSTSLTAFDSTFAHTRTSSTPCSQPRHPTCDVCPYITCVWRHTLWSMLERFGIQK